MIKNKANYFTSAEAAIILGVTHDYVRKLIQRGKLKGEKFGRNWIILRKNLTKIKRLRFPREKESSSDGSNK